LYKQVLCFNVICQSVTLVSPAKRAETIKFPFAFRTQVGPVNHVGLLRGVRRTWTVQSYSPGGVNVH